MTDSASKLVGTWKLAQFDLKLTDGRLIQPLGDEPVGRLFYSETGLMSAHLMPGGKIPKEAASKLDSDVSALSYCGRYSVEGDQIFHDVEIASRPGWTGTTRVRGMSFEGEELILKTDGSRYGELEGIGILRWRRAN